MTVRFAIILACGLMIVSGILFRPSTPYDQLWLAVVLLIMGGLLLRQSPQNQIDALPESHLEPMRSTHRVMAALGVLLMVVLAVINAGGVAATTDAQFFILVFAVLLLIFGFGAASLRPTRMDWIAFGLVAALTVIALLLRLWQLNQTVRFFVDELSYATAVGNLRVDPTTRLLIPMEGTAAFPYLFPYLESKTVALLGRNLAGFRAASALAGALTIPAVYMLARALFSRRVALIAALLLATFPPHLHFSRLGVIEATGAVSGALALAFLMRGFVHNRRLDYAAGGVLLGLTHYFHEGARVLFTPVAVMGAILVLVAWRPPPPNRIRYILIAALLTVIVALPIYTTLRTMDFSITSRLNSPHIALDGDYWRELLASGGFYWHIRWHIIEPFLIFVHQPDRGLFYAGQTPMLLDFLVPPFLIGLWVVLWQWRRTGLLIMWVLAVIFGNMLLAQSTIMTRYVVVFPAVMILVALGLCTAMEALLSGRIRLQRVFLVVFVVVLSVAQVRYYFDRHVPLYNVQFRSDWGHRDAQDAVLRSLTFSPGTQIHIISRIHPDPFHTHGLLMFHRDDLTLALLTPEDANGDMLSGLARDVDHAFFIEPNEPALLERLRQYFDLEGPTFSPYDLPSKDQFALYMARREV